MILVAVKSDLFPSPSSLLLILVSEIITKWSGHEIAVSWIVNVNLYRHYDLFILKGLERLGYAVDSNSISRNANDIQSLNSSNNQGLKISHTEDIRDINLC